MKARKLQCLILLVCALSFQVSAFAQTTAPVDKAKSAAKIKKAKEAPEDFTEYLFGRVWDTTESIISKRRDTNQSEAPSISSNATSLVDRSSVADLVGVGLNLAGLSSESNEEDATSQSVTVSLYALKAAAEGANPLDPSYYTRNRNWRKASVTLGYDFPEDKVGDVNERAIIFGFKYNPLDKRDGSHPDNAALIEQVSVSLQKVNVQYQKMRIEVVNYLVGEITKAGAPFEKGIPINAAKRPKPQPGEPDLTPLQLLQSDILNAMEDTNTFQTVVLPFLERDEVKREIDDIIARYIGAVAEFRETVLDTLETIRKKAQVSFAYFTKQRKEDRADEHQFKAIIDKGISPRWNFTFNAGFDYVDNKMMEDTKGGMASIATQIHLNRDDIEGALPWTLSLSGHGSWMTDKTPTYVGQAKLTIPLAFGMELPLSVSFANRTELIKEADVKGRFGFTFDLARLAQAFSGGLLKDK